MRQRFQHAGDLLVVARLWAIAATVRALKYAMPLPRLVALAAAPIAIRRSQPRVNRLLRLARSTPPGTRLPGNCLERSLGLFRLLIAAGAEPRLAIGMKATRPGRMIDGHVWVVLDDAPVGESADAVASFERLTDFDAQGRSASSGVRGLYPAR